MSKIIETLAAELERRRELSPKVLNYISTTYEMDYDRVGDFLTGRLSTLEDDEVDLILSPVFTPKLDDQAVFADLLGRESVPREEWPAIIRQLGARPTLAQLVTPDGRSHSVPLRDVTMERYVYRLRLDATIPEYHFTLIQQISSGGDRPLLKAIARRAVWESDGRRRILESYLKAAGRDGYRSSDPVDLLDLMESYKPADVAALLAWIPGRLRTLREQIDTGYGPKPFFSTHVEQLHGGGRDQRQQDDARVSAKQQEFNFLERLGPMLAGS